ncbi:hypothetical protein [Bizionia sp.]|uniref:hypothetical protein n=1 Tax=Bizionia sp. TaxID=1954480 RepID=UPI003A93A8AB
MKHIKVILEEIVKILLLRNESTNINLKEGVFDQWRPRNRQNAPDEIMREASKHVINPNKKC